jgi:hypothetical protein
MSLSTQTEVDRLLAITVTAKHKIPILQVKLITALPEEQQQLYREIGELRSAYVAADNQLQALQSRMVA